MLEVLLTLVKPSSTIVQVTHEDTTCRVILQVLHGRVCWSAGLLSLNAQLAFIELSVHGHDLRDCVLLRFVCLVLVSIDDAMHVVQNAFATKVMCKHFLQDV